MRRAASGPAVLVAAGLEPTGRVGLLADVAAVSAAGGVPWGFATALTAQGRDFRCEAVPGALLAAQLDATLAEARPASVKLGMVPDARTLAVLWQRFARLPVPLVVDPVVRTSRGEGLSRLHPADFRALAGPRVWLTPNVLELAWLLGQRAAPESLQAVAELGATLRADGFAAVVVKGGHLPGPPVDVLVLPEAVRFFAGSRLARAGAKRGTGCRFSSTLATALARGLPAPAAVSAARRAVRRYLRG